MTEFLERLNKPKAVFVLALLMMAGVGYAVIRHELKEQRLPGQPTIKRVELQVADRDLSSKITPQRVSRYWGFGPRNFFQPPRPNIKVTGYFSVSASAESKIDLVRVSGNYMCVPDAPVGQIEIQFPAAWLSHLTGMSDNVKSKMLGGTRREMQITLKEVQKGEFRINLTLTMPLKGQTQIEFPEIIFKDAASETGQITLMGTQSYDLKATTVEKLDPTASQGGAQAYRYTSHPYKLGLALTKKAVVAAPPKPKPPTNRPGPDDGKKPDGAKHPNVDQPPPEEPAFEVPFTFKGMVKIGKPTALLEGKEDKKLKRYTVGDTVDGLTITAIYATSVVVRDEKGHEYELQDALRQKYDYE